MREFCDIKCDSKGNTLNFTKMPAFFVCVVKSTYSPEIQKVKQALEEKLKEQEGDSFKQQMRSLKASDVNYLLFQCEQEQQETQHKKGYKVGKDTLVYQGIAGVYSQVKRSMETNDLGLLLYDNVRQGDWLMAYWTNRLYAYPQLHFVALYL